MTPNERLGISGRLARAFFDNQITPLLALVAVLLGVLAVIITPKEEDPQIDVTFANVFIAYPGASAEEVESLVASPAEKMLSEVRGLDHIYSASMPGMAVLSVQFKVGEPRTDALVRLYNKLYSNQDWLPRNLGVMQPIVKPKGIDDVPVLSLTLSGTDGLVDRLQLARVAHAIEAEIKRIPGTNEVFTIGAPDDVVNVELDPARMAALGISFDDLRMALQATNQTSNSASTLAGGRAVAVQAGAYLTDLEGLRELVVGMHEGAPVFLEDVARIERTGYTPTHMVLQYPGAGSESGVGLPRPAVTLAIAKKSGVNAADVADAVMARMDQLRGTYIPDNVAVTVTRNYGETATDKANTLLKKLLLVTVVVVLLVGVTLGRREAFVVGTAVIVTLMATLFASWAFGFTINRVSLFALIFSIGILVDDAIVVVENIHRHMTQGGKTLREAIPLAVDEVGGPTILATFTVIAALLPMAFVTGLMGPYMSPIPINASAGMFLSLLVAFMFTPWLMFRVFRNSSFGDHKDEEAHTAEVAQGAMHRIMRPFLYGARTSLKRRLLYLTMVVLIGGSMALVVTQHVILKMLPFDNKSEFQVVVDMPEGTSVETTARVLDELASWLQKVPEVTDIEAYAGTSSPINFNGLVRQYYLRSGPHQGDLQVNLKSRHDRDRVSHDIALSVREPLQAIGKRYGANVKIVEVPPGPPVLSPIVAEVYGQNYPAQIGFAKSIRSVFEQTDGVVDVDDSVEADTTRYIVHVDQQKAARLGVSQAAIVAAMTAGLKGEDVSYLHSPTARYPIPVRLGFDNADKADRDQFLQLRVWSQSGALVPIRDLVRIEETDHEKTRYHKDLLPVVYVTADGAGETDSPLYGMFDIMGTLSDQYPGLEQALTSQPENPYVPSIKWDGEWQVTYETFRDMGIAYAVGLVGIFLLIVAQFRSYLMPLVIMAPIPLTLIGIMPGHALFGAQFTATSMIGMIALAGIIVRNSILLVDFIRVRLDQGFDLREAVIDAAATRARPIILTALAAILDAFFILDDPIFNGLAVALISGVFVSTLLTLVVIPLLYFSAVRRRYNM
ncbi:MAG: efflux RND transporter permease subunit [Gammaproteobacteria bacterium]|nr:MAG: efflux RND transporter permease subunit [Gammaproteobacteria bacterium]